MRERMAELFHDPSCARWWLPDDEAFSPILKSVRTFADERNATAVTAQSDKLRDARQIFAKMQLGIIGTSTETGKPRGGVAAGAAGASSSAAAVAASSPVPAVPRQGLPSRMQAKEDSSASDNRRLDSKGKGPNTLD